MEKMELTKDKLITNFSYWLHSNKEHMPLPNRGRHSVLPREHRFYPVRQFSSLIQLLQIIPDDSHQFMGRYIVSYEHRMLFSRDGEPGFFIPTHVQMSHHRPVLAAGNFFFNLNGEITAFNHDSPDFQLPVESLVWPLIISELMGAPLAEDFHLIPNTIDMHCNIIPTQHIYLSKTDRQSLLSDLPGDLRKTIEDANSDVRVILNENQSLERYQITPPFNFSRMFTHRIKENEEQLEPSSSTLECT